MRTFSDNPKSFTFHYTFKDFETAQVGAHALIGYMVGTYYQPVIDVSYQNDDQGGTANQLCVEYAEDRKLNKVFKRICDSFKDYNTILDNTEEIEHQYKLERVEQLKQSETFDSLLDKVVAYELELLDYAERLLSDEPTPLTDVTACSTLELLGDDAIDTLKRVDTDQEYKGLWN